MTGGGGATGFIGDGGDNAEYMLLPGSFFKPGPLGEGQFFQRYGGSVADRAGRVLFSQGGPDFNNLGGIHDHPFFTENPDVFDPFLVSEGLDDFEDMLPVVEQHPEPGGPLNGFTEPFGPAA